MDGHMDDKKTARMTDIWTVRNSPGMTDMWTDKKTAR